MTLTDEMLATIEREAAGAFVTMLEYWMDVVRGGMADAPPEVAEHGKALLLKLEYLVHCQRAEAIRPSDHQEYLAPWDTIGDTQRVAA